METLKKNLRKNKEEESSLNRDEKLKMGRKTSIERPLHLLEGKKDDNQEMKLSGFYKIINGLKEDNGDYENYWWG